ncbi:hypothetical protein A3G55_02850 [Candidatus Giovannonibacteria bacterium RIFCSPLOWO2_12_FULL_44_25]|uniref:Type I phosphodiesterase/nucleotide pyrophosphatase n=2 Tax=Parcubacteria group TaxID=1794811 RepID=A0A837IGD5_9BACT|nr:MAG: Type I phosphodiesterase/nucleotide pyrophosphatase [Candidatus Azambacteria bacterium GW2011_GWC2_45_7b]OGF49974.1 MAG: hypothetical protein A2120_04675 [Candidatus Giovannonibacteria bacterium GWA2_45_15]OGF59273.1 MAG: hypothetical protein A2W40_03805 [Candidatus Giovannonibacteria bacterium RIFCSPHIGHO2_01_45_12]OGF60608.1 MAG: hypothetical protein A2656_00835 [Candidatus Giovannonibacteria bacterium RIFCSPHIGHO2_01_FULL_44_100]OGF72891.1 MAG: hypothetical protein A3C05_02200 [Candi
MKFKKTSFLLLVFLCLSCAGIKSADYDYKPSTFYAEKVVLISIDGLSSEVLLKTFPDLIKVFVENGSYSWKARSVFPSQTVPAHISMISGVVVLSHGFISNWMPFSSKISVPTIFSTAHSYGVFTATVFESHRLDKIFALQKGMDIESAGTQLRLQ